MSESLFTTQTPSTTDANDAAPGITRGVTLTFAVDGSVTAIRWWCPTTTSGTYTVAIWELTSGSTGDLLGTKVHSGSPTGDDWNTTTLDSPATVHAGKGYRVGVHNDEGRYVATGLFFTSSGLANGDITAPKHGDPAGDITSTAQGVFDITATLQFPNTTFNQTNYFADVVFTAGSGADAALAVTATLAASATRNALVAAALPVTATLSAGAARNAVADAALAVTATLTTSAARNALVAAALPVTATLGASAGQGQSAAASLAVIATWAAVAHAGGAPVARTPTITVDLARTIITMDLSRQNVTVNL